MAEKTKKTSFLERLGNAGGALVDGLAAQEPLVGMPVQALLNTKGYQDRELRREANKQALIADQARYKEYMDGAPSRQKARAASDMQADEYMADAPLREKKDKAASAVAARTQMAAEEDMSPDAVNARKQQQEAQLAAAKRTQMLANEDTSPEAVNTRKQQRDAENSRARYAEEVADQTHKNARTAELLKGLQQDLATNPAYATMSFAEQKAFAGSPRTQALLESKYYMEEIMGISGNDPQALARMNRALQREGWSLVDGKDGVKYLDMGENGMLPATKEGIQAIQKMVAQSAMEELNTRARISDASTLGDPLLRSVAQRTRTLMPFNGNDATASNKLVEGIFNQASEEEKGWHIFNQAIKDYNDSGLPPQAKMAGIQKCLPFLKQLGYAVDFDPKNPDPVTARIYDIKNQKNISFGEFAEICKQNDTLSATFDNHARDAGVRFEQEQKQALLKTMRETDKNISDDSAEEPESEALKTYLRENISEYSRLSGRESSKIKKAYGDFTKENKSIIDDLARTPTADDLDNLKAIDLSWKNILKDSGLDPSKFPSPVQEEISRIELPDLYEQREGLESSPELKARNTPLKAVGNYMAGGLLRPSNRKAIIDKIKLESVKSKIQSHESSLEK